MTDASKGHGIISVGIASELGRKATEDAIKDALELAETFLAARGVVVERVIAEPSLTWTAGVLTTVSGH